MDLPYCASLLPFLELLIYENLNEESVLVCMLYICYRPSLSISVLTMNDYV